MNLIRLGVKLGWPTALTAGPRNDPLTGEETCKGKAGAYGFEGVIEASTPSLPPTPICRKFSALPARQFRWPTGHAKMRLTSAYANLIP